MSDRPSKDAYFLSMAALVATRGTCLRRRVGAVLVNARGHVLSTGYNGVAAGVPHCSERVLGPHVWRDDSYEHPHDRDWQAVFTCTQCGKVVFREPTTVDRLGGGCARSVSYPHACAGADAPSGASLDACGAIHAEQNALLQCRDVYEIDTCYCTNTPCVSCAKLLLNTSVKRVVVAERYAHDEVTKKLLDARGIELLVFSGVGGA